MSLPDNPQSRSEQYLNAIATGDNSGLPASPESRMDQYLDYIAKNGGGGSGGGVLVAHMGEVQEVVLTGTLPNVSGYAWRSEMSGTLQYYVTITCDLSGYDTSSCTVTIGEDEYSGDDVSYLSGTLRVRVGDSNSGYQNEADVLGKTITVIANQTRLDKTWQEIYDAGFCVLAVDGAQPPMIMYYFLAISAIASIPGSGYAVAFGEIECVSNTADGYPVVQS